MFKAFLAVSKCPKNILTGWVGLYYDGKGVMLKLGFEIEWKNAIFVKILESDSKKDKIKNALKTKNTKMAQGLSPLKYTKKSSN